MLTTNEVTDISQLAVTIKEEVMHITLNNVHVRDNTLTSQDLENTEENSQHMMPLRDLNAKHPDILEHSQSNKYNRNWQTPRTLIYTKSTPQWNVHMPATLDGKWVKIDLVISTGTLSNGPRNNLRRYLNPRT